MEALDEKLAEAVRLYPCLYDKRVKSFKNRTVTGKAWRSIAKKLGIEDGEMAKRLFYNLKKRYNRRRNDLKKAEILGASEISVSFAKAKVEEFEYLAWLSPFLRVRNPMINVPKQKKIAVVSRGENAPSEGDNDEHTDSGHQHDRNDFEEDDSLCYFSSTPLINFKRKSSMESENSSVAKRKKWSRGKGPVNEVELGLLASMRKAIEASRQGEKKDDEDLFGMLVASELRQLNSQNKRMVKNQIQNFIYQVQVQEQTELQS